MGNDIIKFLLGEESFDGVWFGEKHTTEQGAFWWRKHLRQFINENQALRIHGVNNAKRTVHDPDWEMIQTAPHGIQYKHKKTGETKWE